METEVEVNLHIQSHVHVKVVNVEWLTSACSPYVSQSYPVELRCQISTVE